MTIRIPFEQYIELKEALKKVGIRTRFAVWHGSERTVEGIKFDNPYKTAVELKGTDLQKWLIEMLRRPEF